MGLSHTDSQGNPQMVDVSAKDITSRLARAQGTARLGAKVAEQLANSPITAKGNVLQVARLAGIQAAKRTSELIPLCHPLPLERIEVTAELVGECVRIQATVAARARTGLDKRVPGKRVRDGGTLGAHQHWGNHLLDYTRILPVPGRINPTRAEGAEMDQDQAAHL